MCLGRKCGEAPGEERGRAADSGARPSRAPGDGALSTLMTEGNQVNWGTAQPSGKRDKGTSRSTGLRGGTP